jgi:hypothetical protein
LKIDQWGENAKWKLDLVLLDKPQPQQSNSLHPLLSPQHLHPNVITTPSGGGDSKSTYSLPISSTIEFPVSTQRGNANIMWLALKILS